MPSFRWSRVISLLIGVSTAAGSGSAWAFQFPLPLNDDLNTRHLHDAESWVGGGFQSSGNVNQSPADFGPITGMGYRTPDGNPLSGEDFPLMQPGPLPGGFSADGFNSSGMRPPVNQPAAIANNPLFGGNGQLPNQNYSQQNYGQFGNGSSFGPNGQPMLGPNGQPIAGRMAQDSRYSPLNSRTNPNGTQQTGRVVRPKFVNATSSKRAVVGLLGQVVRPGVYEMASNRVLLSDLIERIGGLANKASGQFRIIRNGRSGQTLGYQAASQFELMSGDLVVADSQTAFATSSPRPHDAQTGERDSTQTASAANSGAVQIGFVNLLDRPVVLKLRSEHATVSGILSLMRQDSALSSRVRVVLPAGQQQTGSRHPDAPLPSESILVFPANTVLTERLSSMPEPVNLDQNQSDPNSLDSNKRGDAATSSRGSQPTNISPDVTQRVPFQPAGTARVIDIPAPPDDAMLPAQRDAYDNRDAASRAMGVRGHVQHVMPEQDRAARDSQMVPAPPAERANQTSEGIRRGTTMSPSTRDVPTTTMMNDAATAPAPLASSWSDREDQTTEPSLFSDDVPRKPIRQARNKVGDEFGSQNEDDLTSLGPDALNTDSQASTTWSIWPPIVTAIAGVLTLIGFSLSLRRKTQLGARTAPNVAMPPAAPLQPTRTPIASQTPRQQWLDAIINNQLPMTEEKVAIASPMQFHGRPNPPRTLRVDHEHSLPKPHAPNSVPVTASLSANEPFAADSMTDSTPTFRLEPVGPSVSQTQATATRKPMTNMRPTTKGVLDRALSAVQQREEHA